MWPPVLLQIQHIFSVAYNSGEHRPVHRCSAGKSAHALSLSLSPPNISMQYYTTGFLPMAARAGDMISKESINPK